MHTSLHTILLHPMQILTLQLGRAVGDGSRPGEELDRERRLHAPDEGDGDPRPLHRNHPGHRRHSAPVLEEPGAREEGRGGGLKQPCSTPSPAMLAIGCHSQSLSRAGAEPGHSLAIGPHRTGLGWTTLHPTSPSTAGAVLQGRRCPIENSFGWCLPCSPVVEVVSVIVIVEIVATAETVRTARVN